MDQKKSFQQIEERLGFEKQILTLEEAVLYTGLSKHTLYKLTSQKKITYYKPGGKKIIFRRKDIDDFIFANPK